MFSGTGTDTGTDTGTQVGTGHMDVKLVGGKVKGMEEGGVDGIQVVCVLVVVETAQSGDL